MSKTRYPCLINTVWQNTTTYENSYIAHASFCLILQTCCQVRKGPNHANDDPNIWQQQARRLPRENVRGGVRRDCSSNLVLHRRSMIVVRSCHRRRLPQFPQILLLLSYFHHLYSVSGLFHFVSFVSPH